MREKLDSLFLSFLVAAKLIISDKQLINRDKGERRVVALSLNGASI